MSVRQQSMFGTALDDQFDAYVSTGEYGRGFCSAEGCERSAFTRGWCKAHYERWRRHGDVMAALPVGGLSQTERMWRRINKAGAVGAWRPDLGPCWEWMGARFQGSGYAMVTVDRNPRRGHRYIYELLVGPIPDGLTLDHLCMVRHCVNPTHLEPVTNGENQRRSPFTLAGANARKTHCPRGHEYDAENTCYSGGRRHCRACRREKYAKTRALASERAA